MGVRLAELEAAGRVEGPAYADLQHQFETLGGYTLDLRVDEALSGLGFARDEWAKPPTALSGGEQTRATLARLVIAQPDLLLLDEPTNHLDIGAIEWLEEHLRRHGALLVASHDRAFLDATVGRV
jgi:ATP-binding cassette subfamily F protein 3